MFIVGFIFSSYIHVPPLKEKHVKQHLWTFIVICVVSVPPAVSAHPSNRLSASPCADRKGGHDGADMPAEDSAAEVSGEEGLGGNGERAWGRACRSEGCS